MEMGPVSDTFDFLSNALVFAGQGTGYSSLLRPPFFSVIVSLFFRLGFVYASTIFAVDGGLFIFGVIGLFLLLKTRFNNLESFLGGLLYATFPIILTYLAVGFSDLASVSFTIWSFYFLVLTVKKDSKFFYLVFPFAMFAFLTRYNNALIIFPILLYLFINKDKVNFKKIFIGITASILIILPVLIFYYEKYGNIIYPFINFGSNSANIIASSESLSYDPNVLFYVQNFPQFVGSQGFIILLIIAMAALSFLLFKIIKKIGKKEQFYEGIGTKIRLNRVKLAIFAILVIAFLGTFDKIFYMVSEVIFFALLYLFYELTKNSKIKDMNLNIMVFGWLMTFFIFNSIFFSKDYRYFVLMAPPVTFFMILGLSEISNRIRLMIKNTNITFPLLSTILVTIILLSTACYIPSILATNGDKVIQNQDIESASQWFANYDPNYKDQNIYADLYPNFSWYLKTNVQVVPVFKDNQIFYNGVKNYTFNQADSNAFNTYLINNHADYYLSIRHGLNLTSYTPIKTFGQVTIYKRK